MNSSRLIRVVLASALLAAVGCADGQRSSRDSAGKGKKMNRALTPSTTLTNGKNTPASKTGTNADGTPVTNGDSRAESTIANRITDLERATPLDELPAGTFRLVGSVTVFKLPKTNEFVTVLRDTTYGTDDNFTPNVGAPLWSGLFKTFADQGRTVEVPLQFTVTGKKISAIDADVVLKTQVKGTATAMSIEETMEDMVGAKTIPDVTISDVLATGKSASTNAKISNTLSFSKTLDGNLRIVVLIVEPQADKNESVSRNLYLTYKRVEATPGQGTSTGSAAPGTSTEKTAPGGLTGSADGDRTTTR